MPALPPDYAVAYRYALQYAQKFVSDAEAASDRVHDALIGYMSGRRVWDPSRVSFGGFLQGCIRSDVSARKKRDDRKKKYWGRFERFEACTAEILYSEAEDGERLSRLIERFSADDPELVVLVRAIADGALKRNELACELGWSPDRVSRARLRLQRRLLHSDYGFKRPRRGRDVAA